MPIPKPYSNESRSNFIERCMSDDVMVSDYESSQRMAICSNEWDKKNNMNTHSYKSLECKIKDIDEKGIVTFYYNAFGNIDSDNDESAFGSHRKSQTENRNRIKHFKNHNIYQAPGVIKELGEDQFGAWARTQLILGSTLGRDTYEEYKAGAITEHSFGYNVLKFNTGDKGQRVITEYKIHEVSSLTGWGANERTPVTDIKSETDALIVLEKLLKLQKGMFSDEKLKEIELKINELSLYIKSLREPKIHSDEPTTDCLENLYLKFKLI